MTYPEFKAAHPEPCSCKSIRALTGLSQRAFAAEYGIPYRTIENWEQGSRGAPEYVLDLLLYAVLVGN